MPSYEVRPEDVVVLDNRSGQPDPHGRGAAGWLRRYRLRIAIGLGIFESLAFAFGRIGALPLLLIGIAAVAFHLWWGRHLRSRMLRQVSWIICFAQGIVALIPAIIGFAAIGLIIAGTVALLVLMMVLLGDRGR
jgi:hypothetical protein